MTSDRIPRTVIVNGIERPARPPSFIFVHEWWWEDDEVELAGVLFRSLDAGPSQPISQLIAERIVDELLIKRRLGTLQTDRLCCPIWMDPEDHHVVSVGDRISDPAWIACINEPQLDNEERNAVLVRAPLGLATYGGARSPAKPAND